MSSCNVPSLCIRIIEIEWAVKNNTTFEPSPRKKTRTRRRKPKSIAHGSDAEDEGAADLDDDGQHTGTSKPWHQGASGAAAEFGLEITNVASPAKSKRARSPTKQVATGEEDREAGSGTPPKKQKMLALYGEDSEYLPPTSPSKDKGRLLLA